MMPISAVYIIHGFRLYVLVTTEMLSDMSFKSFKKYIKNVILAKFKIFWADFRANNITADNLSNAKPAVQQRHLGD